MEIRLNIPPDIYSNLLEISRENNKTIEEFILEIIRNSIKEMDYVTSIHIKNNNETSTANNLFKKFHFVKELIHSSNSMKDWKEAIKKILEIMSKELPIDFLFTVVAPKINYKENICEVDLFWLSTPDKLEKEQVSQKIKDIFSHRPCLSIDIIEHHVLKQHRNKGIKKNKPNSLDIKYIKIEKPKIGDVLAIGVGIPKNKSKIDSNKLNQLLEIILSIVNSIRAISFYTKEIEHYATRDPLTNLYNQRVFWEFLEYEINRAQRHGYKLALLVIDLDNFKLINDTYGHIFGDLFIEKFAELLQNILDDSTIISRFGGDEFCIILPNANLEQAYTTAQKIKKEAEKMIVIAPDGKPISATVSIGIAIFPDHAKDPKDLFIVADNMMYKAKREGKDRIAYPSEEDLSILFERKEKINATLLYALKNEKIIPYFQPILNIKKNQIEAHEVLMRVEDEEGNILPAAKFIEVAEEMNIIHKLELQLFKKAFRLIKASKYSGLLFINFSPKSITIPYYLDEIRTLATNCGIDTSRIVFEITERETVKNLSILEKFLNDLKEFGFRFAIDDFGSGYSSYLYIKKLPIDFVKIEGDFIKELGISNIDKAIVKSITVLSKELNIKTIAEFVEDETVLRQCQEIGIDYAQGFYIGKPSPQLLR